MCHRGRERRAAARLGQADVEANVRVPVGGEVLEPVLHHGDQLVERLERVGGGAPAGEDCDAQLQ